MSMSNPWRTKKWFTSPWNFADEVKSSYNFADTIKFHDVSLRDGEQQAGLLFSKDEKIMVAEKLAELGIHRIEAGMPAVSKSDEEAIREIVKMQLGPEIFAFCRCMKEDVQRAADLGVDGVIVEIPSSDHMIRNAYRWELEKAVSLSIEATAYAKERNLYTVFFPIDMSRADMIWALDMIKRVADEGHMDALALVDTFGGLNIHSIPYLVKKVRETIDRPLEAHFHDDFGLASANTIMALACGVDVAHTTISAIGERAGNCSYEEVALSLLTMYNYDMGFNYDKVYGLSKLVQNILGIQVRPNHGIIGDDIFKIESGIIAGWYENVKDLDLLQMMPYLPSLIGHSDNEILLGKCSGLPSIEHHLKELGYDIPEKDICLTLLSQVKDKAIENHGLVSLEQFDEMVKKVLS